MVSQERKLTYKNEILKKYTQKFNLNCKPNNVHDNYDIVVHEHGWPTPHFAENIEWNFNQI